MGSQKSMNRVTRYQGALPSVRDSEGNWRKLELDDVRQIRAFVTSAGCGSNFDIVVEGTTPDPEKGKEDVAAWQQAGATWWIESMWDAQFKPNPVELLTKRIEQGPPGPD